MNVMLTYDSSRTKISRSKSPQVGEGSNMNNLEKGTKIRRPKNQAYALEGHSDSEKNLGRVDNVDPWLTSRFAVELVILDCRGDLMVMDCYGM